MRDFLEKSQGRYRFEPSLFDPRLDDNDRQRHLVGTASYVDAYMPKATSSTGVQLIILPGITLLNTSSSFVKDLLEDKISYESCDCERLRSERAVKRKQHLPPRREKQKSLVEFIFSPPSPFVSPLADIIYCPLEVIYEIGERSGSRILATPMHVRSRRAIHSVTVNGPTKENYSSGYGVF
jgi:hypothetical protein